MATIKCTVQRSSWYEVYFEYSYTQDTANDKTTVQHALKLKQLTNGYDFDTVRDVTVGYTVAGTSFSKTARINIDDKGNAGYTITLASGSSVITHNSSTGAGSFTVSVNTSIDSAGYGPGTITLASKTVDLPMIYRASEPTVSASSVCMKGSLTITTNRKSSAFTHTLTYSFGGTTGTIATGVGASYVWTVPDLASKCNNALSGTATITCVTYSGSTKVGTKTCTVTLQVPEASQPTETSVVMGSKVTVSTNRKSSNFTHKITWAFGSKSGTASTAATTSASFVTSLDLAKEIKDKPSAKGKITCVTYNGTAIVGTTDCEFTLTVPNNDTTKPTASWTLSPENDFDGFEGLYLQGKSKVKADYTASSTYSTISSYSTTVNGKSYSVDPATSAVLTKSGSVTVTGKVTDARGYYRTLTKSITVQPYKKPTLAATSGYKAIVCERSKQDGTYDDAGTWLHIRCKLVYYPLIVNNVQKNKCTLSYRYKAEGGSWSSEKELFVSESMDSIGTDKKLDGIVTQTDTSYTVQLIVTDTVGSKGTYEFTIPTADVALHLGEGGYGVAVGKFSEATADHKMFEVADDWDFVMKGQSVVDFVVEQGTSGIWSYRKWYSGRCELYGYHQATGAVEVQSGNAYRSNAITAGLPFKVYDLSLAIDCCEINAWSTSVTYRATEGNESIAYVIWRGGAYADVSTKWSSYIHINGRWK